MFARQGCDCDFTSISVAAEVDTSPDGRAGAEAKRLPVCRLPELHVTSRIPRGFASSTTRAGSFFATAGMTSMISEGSKKRRDVTLLTTGDAMWRTHVARSALRRAH